jgi:hypothetical protein
MFTDPQKSLNQINAAQLSLIDQLDSRQDEIILQLDELSERIERIINLYVQNRDVQNGPDFDENREAA